MIRLYGRLLGGNDSWARVSLGLKSALESLGMLAGWCVVADEVSELDDGLSAGYDAPVGVYIGPPAFANVMLARGQHNERMCLIAANSTWLPERTMANMADFVTGLIGPSRWSCEVIKAHAPELPTYCWQHGVSDAFHPADVYAPGDGAGVFTALHLASSHKQRKGTHELIQAWALAYTTGDLGPGALLRLICDGPRGYFNATIDAACSEHDVPRSIFSLEERCNMTEAETAALYARHHVVVQPSRAEGFGLVPLESQCCGVPVVLSGATGHQEFLEDAAKGVVVVSMGGLGPIDDGPDAQAPVLDVGTLAAALRVAYQEWPRLATGAQQNADALRRAWSWEARTEFFLALSGIV